MQDELNGIEDQVNFQERIKLPLEVRGAVRLASCDNIFCIVKFTGVI